MSQSPDAAGLFERHHVVLFRYFCRVTRRRDQAEDLTQDVFVRALRGLDQYEPRERERAWLFRIARNLLLDCHRRDARRGPTVDLDTADSAIVSVTPLQEEALDLDRSLAQLDALDRDVFLLREVAGLSYVEIGGVCDLTPDAVRSRICRARSRLRALLGDRRPAATI